MPVSALVQPRGWVSLVFVGIASFCLGADQELAAVRVATPPVIDGTIGEDEWKQVPFVEGLHDADTGAAYSDSGRFWLAYDKEFVYFAARLKESEPSAIRATEYRTNVALTGDDYVELDLDLSGSLSAFNTFQINPHGATNISIAGGRASKREWLGAFLAKARISDGGWEVEAKIPWSGMNIPRGGKRNVRFNIRRFIAKNQRTFAFVYTPATQTGLTPTWVGVELPKPLVDHSIKLLPYTYVGHDPATNGVFNAGLDMKTAITDQINLVGSINPDFRNIENQILSIDFSRFERLAGETRPFFQEGREYSNSQIFASQRIHGFDLGLNSYGRITDKTSFAFVGAADFNNETDTVFNVTHDPDADTSIRFTGTSMERPDLSNQSYLLRLSKNMGPFNLFLRDMGSKDTTLGFGRQDDVVLAYIKENFSVTAGWSRAENEFRPRLGFAPEVNYQGSSAEVDYSRSFEKGPMSDYSVSVFGLTYNHIDGSFYRKEYATTLSTTIRPGLNVQAAVDLADFEGSKDSLYSFQLTYPRGNRFNNLSVRADTGRQAGLDYKSVTVGSAYRLNKKLQFTLRHQTVEYDGNFDQTIFTASYDLGSDRSISGRAVQRDGNTNAYLAYRRSGNEGIEYFLILGDPNALKYRNSLILKVVVPLTIGRKGLDLGAKQQVNVLSGTR